MKAFLIDPYVLNIQDKVITISDEAPIREVEFSGDIAEIYRFLSTEDRPVTMFDAARFSDSMDTVYVDDEGLFGADHFIMINNQTLPLAGRGLVLGTDEEGDSVSPEITLEELWANTRIALGPLSVRLSGVPVGHPVRRDDIQPFLEPAVKVWAKEIGVW